MMRIAWRVQRNGARRLIASTRSQSSTASSSIAPRTAVPALLIRRSSRLNRSRVAAKTRSTWDSEVTSAGRARAAPPAAAISSASFRRRSARRATSATAAPSAASPRAMPSPIPLLLPVTRATLPSSLPMIAPRSKGSPRWWGHRAPAPSAGDDLTIPEHRGEVGDALPTSEPPSRGRAPSTPTRPAAPAPGSVRPRRRVLPWQDSAETAAQTRRHSAAARSVPRVAMAHDEHDGAERGPTRGSTTFATGSGRAGRRAPHEPSPAHRDSGPSRGRPARGVCQSGPERRDERRRPLARRGGEPGPAGHADASRRPERPRRQDGRSPRLSRSARHAVLLGDVVTELREGVTLYQRPPAGDEGPGPHRAARGPLGEARTRRQDRGGARV